MNTPPQFEAAASAQARVAKVPVSIWSVVGPLGAAVCAGVASYRSFHGHPALGWAVAIGLFMLVTKMARGLPTPEDATGPTYRQWLVRLLAVAAVGLSGWLAFQTFGLPELGHGPSSASVALVDATLRRDAGAVQRALDDLPDGGRLITVPAEAAAKALSAEQHARLDQTSEPINLLSFALAAEDLLTADLLLTHRHLMRHDERHLLAAALARSDAQQHSRWQTLMLELSQYRDRRLEAMQSKKGGSATVDEAVLAGMLRRQANFLPHFDEADASEVLKRCDARTLEFIIDQDPDKGQRWALNLGLILARLQQEDRSALESSGSANPGQDAQPCLAVANVLLGRARLRGAGDGHYVFDGLLGSFSFSSWNGEMVALIDAYADVIRKDLRANAGLGDFDDASFDPSRIRRYLAQRPPPYPHTLKFLVLLMKVSPEAIVLQHAFRSPLFYFYHPAFQQDGERALQAWRAGEAPKEAKLAIQMELATSTRAYADLGPAHGQQKGTLRRWLSEAGLSCELKKAQPTWPGQVMIGFKC